MAFDKPVASTLVSGTGVAVPEFVVMPQSTFRELGAPAVMAAIGDRIGFPLVVKPTRGGSALGLSIVRQSEDLPHAMVSAFAYGETVMIQRFISGTEVAVSVIDGPDGIRALPAVEIVPESGMYDYHARYTAGRRLLRGHGGRTLLPVGRNRPARTRDSQRDCYYNC